MKDEIIKFREALDKIDWSMMPIQFQKFPTGTCGDVSDILAEYLYSLGIQPIEYVCGIQGGASHAWLEIDGKAIDVTADQFKGVSEKVLIQPSTVWHSKYEIENRRKAGYLHFKGPAVADIMRVHGTIMEQLKNA